MHCERVTESASIYKQKKKQTDDKEQPAAFTSRIMAPSDMYLSLFIYIYKQRYYINNFPYFI